MLKAHPLKRYKGDERTAVHPQDISVFSPELLNNGLQHADRFRLSSRYHKGVERCEVAVEIRP